MNDSELIILGARGSVPVSAPAFFRYGTATTCVVLRLAGQYIILDAGTGILRLPEDVLAQSALSLLLTHVHLDHLCGFSMCPYVMKSGNTLDIYASPADGSEIGALLNRLFAPPVWPVQPDQLAASLRYHALPDRLELGAVSVSALDGVHPGGVKLLRLSGAGKSVVFATDCTLTEEFYPKAVEFAGGCDLLLCDGQYSADEMKTRAGFGHNTWLTAARFGRDCRAGAVRIVHHDPTHDDAVLDRAGEEAAAVYPVCRIAREGEVIAF